MGFESFEKPVQHLNAFEEKKRENPVEILENLKSGTIVHISFFEGNKDGFPPVIVGKFIEKNPVTSLYQIVGGSINSDRQTTTYLLNGSEIRTISIVKN